VIGVLVLVDGVLTLVWEEPVSGLLARISQNQLAKSLNALEHQRPTVAEERALNGLPTDQQRLAYFARNLQLTAQPGQAVGRIVIPRIGADFVVVAGTAAASLRKGPGLYSGTSVPGLEGTVGIAGHRTTYLAPFRRINELGKDDLITLQMPYGIFTYTVTGHKIVAPNNIAVLRPTGYDQVVLTACNPLYSASQRLAVFARLTSSVPTGLALGTAVPQTTPSVAPAIPAGQLDQALLGSAVPAQIEPFPIAGATGGASRSDSLLVNPPSAVAHKPAVRAHTPTPAGGSSSPATRVQSPAVRTTPAFVAPRQPTPIVQPRQPVRVTPTKPAATPPSKSQQSPSATPGAGTPPTSQSQTRVQGEPGGPAPIIGTSG
jgi:sortase A